MIRPILMCVVLVVLLPSLAQAGRVQAKTAFASSTANPAPVSVSFDSTPAVGNFVTVQFGYGNAGVELSTITFSDNQGGNTYTVDNQLNDNLTMGKGVGIGSAQIAVAAGTFTVTASSPNTLGQNHLMWIAIQEWSGIETSSALDKTQQINNRAGPDSTGPDTGTTAALAQASELVVAASIKNANGTTWTKEQAGTVPASGWTEEYNSDGTGQQNGVAETVIVSATTGVRHVWLLSGATRWMAVEATYKLALRGCYLMENATDFYLMENGTDEYLQEGGDGGTCPAGAATTYPGWYQTGGWH